jgi:ATP-dependent helicase HrpA
MPTNHEQPGSGADRPDVPDLRGNQRRRGRSRGGARRRGGGGGPKPDSEQLAGFRARLEDCPIYERRRLGARLRQLDASNRDRVERFEADLRKAEARRASRSRLAVTPTYPPELPVSERRGEIAAAIRDHQVVVVCGETGSGKTTQLPKICLELGRGIDGAIGHTQPRRLAARSVAARIAQELSTPLGKVVGYKVRFDDRSSGDTLVKVMTDGVLLAETQSDRDLTRYDTIIIDEAHERSLNIDFLLGYLKRLLPRRPDLKVIITSATIDPGAFAKHFADAVGEVPIVMVSGRTYPVEVRYRPVAEAAPGKPLEPEDVDVPQAVVDALSELTTEPGGSRGDVLVFLSGEREIRETAKAIRKANFDSTEVLPLYSRLASTDQDRIFKPHKGRRVVLSTNIAETSLTVPGIRFVIDPGFVRMSRYSARGRVQRLPIEAVSRASADQRKGRCGRVQSGICIRLYEESDFQSRPAFTDPEILRTNLASVILQMYALNLGSIERFPFLDPPRASMVREGEQTLIELGALRVKEESGGDLGPRLELTELGRQLARLPVDPRIGRIILAGADEQCVRETLIIASALSIQDPRERPSEQRDRADKAHERFTHEGSDFLSYLLLWDAFHEQRGALGSSRLKKWCVEHFLNYVRLREWIETHDMLARLAREVGLSGAERLKKCDDPDAVHRSLLAGLLSNIGYRPEKYEYEGPGNSRFYLFPGSALFEERPKWVVTAEIVETERRYARIVGPIQPKWVEEIGSHLITRQYSDPKYVERTGKVMAKEKVVLSGLTILSGRSVHFGPVDPATSRELFIYHGLVHEGWATRGRFMQQNRALIEEVEQVEAKQRKRDVLVEDFIRYAFYDERVPEGIYTGEAFETWRIEAERQDANLLLMSREDLMTRDPEEVTEELFPNQLPVNGSPMPLEYELKPGEKTDGVTLTVPVEALAQLDEATTTWLVPGLLEEKIVALIRTLPKSYRRALMPVPQTARTCARQIESLRGSRSFFDAVVDSLQTIAGTTIPRELFRPEQLPDHLRMRVRVVDEKGEPIGEGRDLPSLKRDLGPRMRSSFESISEKKWIRDGIRDWDFGDLPATVPLERGGVSVNVFPALVDQGIAAGIRLFESEATAMRAHRDGLRRLYMIRAIDELKYHAQYLPDFEEMVVHYAPIGPGEELREDVLEVLADKLFVAPRPEVRTQQAFDAQLGAAWHRIGELTHWVCELVTATLRAYHRLQIRLEQPPKALREDALRDIRSQVEHLMRPPHAKVPRRFLRTTPTEWLVHYPRYLKAIDMRLDRCGRDAGQRDAELMVQVKPHWDKVRQLMEQRPELLELLPPFEELRWMIEEFRVSLFAQELKTAVPVSAKRIEKQWAKCRG